ncbi:2-hydroxyacid dehydrogenase [Effusibacillus dendaii]|uniref:D-glycerate dehydrogenase n=1 Tax=Effusibacillus dendaii TaxID=2743772 RepID=A0A7I8DDH8_9BACL|nr:D-glycerate dehydrogenase [Effusibacillus dendaii]BCJ86580.1 D-glycerate dehydrogenase [Effusibacillus dendaii]
MNGEKVVVSRQIPPQALSVIKQQADVFLWESEEVPIPRDVLLRECREAVGIFATLTERIDEEFLSNAPNLKVISNMAVGVDNIDVAATTRRGIPVGHTPGVLTETTADLTFALLLASARRVVEGADLVRQGNWKTWSPMMMTGQDIFGATIGIIGMGRIGEAVAKRATGFSMRILYHNRTRRPEVEQSLGATYCSLEELLKQSDFVVVLTPSTAETHHLIGKKELHLMKSTAVLINTSRGSNVDEKALYGALQDGVIWGAGLDVFEQEPIGADHPLLSLENVVPLPHIGSASIATRTNMALLAAKNLIAGIQGEKLLHTVNPEVY